MRAEQNSGRVKGVQTMHMECTTMTHVNVHDAIDETLDAFEDDWSYKVDIRKEYGKIPDVQCDPADLIAALVSVLTEASRIIRDHGVIGIRTWRDDLFVHAAISSSGTAVSQLQFPQILDPANAPDRGSDPEECGIDILGKLLRELHGSLCIESGGKIGTTFTFKLPVNIRSGAASAYDDQRM